LIATWSWYMTSITPAYAGSTSEDQHAIDMRSSSHFACVLVTRERTEALLAFERVWRDGVHDRRTA
jgi:hypothetical protein